MSGPLDDQLGFAPDYDAAIPYMQRTRDYYAAIGYTTPYRWAHYCVAPRFFGAPTNRSHRVTIDVDAPEILARCQADKVDVAVIVPNCPVCHQTSALVARHLEANGIATVVMGCAKDIVEHAAVPRFLFSDFPLGNSAGKPHDVESQALTLELALRLLETAPGARTTMQSPLRWSEDASWKLDYNNIAQMSPEELAWRRAEFDKQKEIARGNRAA